MDNAHISCIAPKLANPGSYVIVLHWKQEREKGIMQSQINHQCVAITAVRKIEIRAAGRQIGKSSTWNYVRHLRKY